MKSLFAMTLLAATFLGGYYLGHQPDSPDIFGWARTACEVAGQAGDALAFLPDTDAGDGSKRAPSTRGPSTRPPQGPPPETPPIAVVEIGGQVYRIGVQ